MFLAIAILTVQVITLSSIRDLIESVNDLKVQKKTYYETMFIFAFFAINVLIIAGVNLLKGTSGRQLETQAEKTAFQAAYSIMGILYLLSYICYINIL